MLESMANVFSKLPSDDKKLAGMVTEASTNLIHGMGNVLDTFSYTAAEQTENEDHMINNKTKTEESKVGFENDNRNENEIDNRWTFAKVIVYFYTIKKKFLQ